MPNVSDYVEAYARVGDPGTAQDAAEFAAATMAQTEQRVYDYLKVMGTHGATVDEIAHAISIQTESVSPRMRPLERKGLVAETPMRRKLPGKKVGRIVWVAVKK